MFSEHGISCSSISGRERVVALLFFLFVFVGLSLDLACGSRVAPPVRQFLFLFPAYFPSCYRFLFFSFSFSFCYAFPRRSGMRNRKQPATSRIHSLACKDAPVDLEALKDYGSRAWGKSEGRQFGLRFRNQLTLIAEVNCFQKKEDFLHWF